MAGIQRGFRISPSASKRLDELAERRGKPPGELVEDLINEAYETPESYMLKQAAFQSFMAAAMCMTFAQKELGQELFDKLRPQIRQAATMLYGEPPRRSWDLTSVTDADPRIDALFKAWGG